jgi:putative membrane protein
MRPVLVFATALLLATGTLLTSGPVSAQPQPQLSRQERNFVMEALAGSLAERAMGKRAQDRAESPAVRRFAQRLVDDQGLIGDRLIGLAQRHGIPIPREADSTTRAHMASLNEVSEASFDRRYMAASEEMKARAIKLYSAQADREGETADFARDTLPTLRTHFDEAGRVLGELARAAQRVEPGAGLSQ